MKKQKIYFVQTGCVFNNEHFLPYASGIIAACAFSNEKISSCYELADIIYKCENFSDTLKSITEPSVVAFSNYMWNFEFNLKLAKEIKERFCNCTVIFGGHQISDTFEWLEKYPFIDFAVFGEGESIVSNILLALCTDRIFDSIPNISYRQGLEIIKNEEISICQDINKIPSPYLTGVFDKIIKNSNDKFAAVIETSRGCPYHCAYCDWGDYDLPMRHFNAERVKKEIEWLGKQSVVFVVLADSNFGLCDTDEEIVDEFVRVKNKYDYPKAVEIAFAKYSPDRVFSMNKKLYENNMSRGATLSMQTLEPQALKNIGRENITKDKFSKLIRLYSQNNIPAYTELILGLPGETYESFCEGIEYLLDNGQHNSIHVFFCEILPNAVMGTKEYAKEHGLELLERDFILRNGMNSDGIKGKSQIIVATNTLNKEMFLRSILYAFIIQVFHNFGLCRAFALYFHYEKDMRYCDFYNSLMIWLEENPQSCLGKLYSKFYQKYEMLLKGMGYDTYENPAFGNTQFNLSDGAFLEFICAYDEFYKDLASFLASMSDDEILNQEMLRFQKMIIRKPENKKEKDDFSYNWARYYSELIENGKSLLRKEKIELEISESKEYKDLLSYVQEIAIKGRRTGKSIALNDKDSYVLNYIR